MSAPPKGFNKDDYCTPPEVLAFVYAAIGIPDLDPCGSADSLVVSKRALMGKKGDPTDNGLAPTWNEARTVFMNPPYSNTQVWVEQFFDWYRPGNQQQGVMLLSAETGLVWWQELCLQRLHRILFLPRVAFLARGKPVKGTRFNSALCYVGHRRKLIGDIWPRPVFRPC